MAIEKELLDHLFANYTGVWSFSPALWRAFRKEQLFSS
jgi:hypothetical protein